MFLDILGIVLLNLIIFRTDGNEMYAFRRTYIKMNYIKLYFITKGRYLTKNCCFRFNLKFSENFVVDYLKFSMHFDACLKYSGGVLGITKSSQLKPYLHV